MITKTEIRKHQPSKTVSNNALQLFNDIDTVDAKLVLKEHMLLAHCNHTMWQPDAIITAIWYYIQHGEPVTQKTIHAVKNYLEENPEEYISLYDVFFERGDSICEN